MKPRCSKQRSHALTLVEVLVVIVVLAVLAAMLLPSGGRDKKRPQQITCINNLKQVGLAYRIWADDNNDKYPMEVSVTNGGTKEVFNSDNHFQNAVLLNFMTMSNELVTPRILHCPSDTNGFAATNFCVNFGIQNISYFVGLGGLYTNSSLQCYYLPQTFRSGDDNFEIGGVPVKSGILELSTNAPISWTTARHKKSGHILIDDGSVQSLTVNSLRNFWQFTGLATNRLAIP